MADIFDSDDPAPRIEKSSGTAIPESWEPESHARAVLDALVDSVITIDPRGRILWANLAVEKMFGWPPEALVGQNVSILMPEPFASEHNSYLANYLRTGIQKIIGSGREVAGRRIDGAMFPIDLTVTEFTMAEAKLFSGIIRDISVRKRAEEQLTANTRLLNEACSRLARQVCELRTQREKLQELRDEVQRASLIKSQFLANVSHELRTPLTAILGYADLLLQNSVTQPVAEDLQVIRQNGENLLSIINDTLDLSQLEAGMLKPRRSTFSLRLFCEEIRSDFLDEARRKSLEFRMEFTEPLPATLTTDPVRLRQILVHLVGNAIKFTPSGSVLVRISSNRGDASRPPDCQFEVIDTGIGIPPEAHSSIFQPFSQVDPSMARPFGGTGMGLALSQRLARILGGSITLESGVEGGSKFVLRVESGPASNTLPRSCGVNPMMTAQGSSIPAPADAESPGKVAVGPTKVPSALDVRILIAEDIPSNQKLIEFHLRRAGARTCLATNGAEALQAMAQDFDDEDPIRLIILDMQMPIMDGFEAAQRLRKSGYTLPIVALTASTMDGDRERCLQAGCTDYLSKPIDQESLVGAVRRLLEPTSSDLVRKGMGLSS